jgi:putative heme-binding domain-containing protein
MKLGTAVILTLLVGVAPAAALPFAQHETAADIEDGGRVFRGNCANCHGPDGDQVAGIDLGRGQFRRPLSDAELAQIIRSGIPGTPMPASNFSDEQARRVVAYLRSLAATKRSASAVGDSTRGQAIFEGKGTCTTCHRVKGTGSRLGPDLSEVGQSRRAAELEQSLVDPDAEIAAANRFYRVVTKDGTVVTGRLLNLDSFSVQLLDGKEQLRSFEKSAVQEYGFVDKTPMPSYRDRLNPQELADVVSYLVSLKGKINP